MEGRKRRGGRLAARLRDERGEAVVELLLCIPITLTFIAGAVDLATLITSRLTMDNAATTAARYVEDRPELFCERASDGNWVRPISLSQGAAQELAAYLDETLGTTAFEDGTCSVAIALSGDETGSAYTHAISTEDGEEAARESTASSQAFTVTIGFKYGFKTPIGAMMGGDAEQSATQASAFDTTDGATW